VAESSNPKDTHSNVRTAFPSSHLIAEISLSSGGYLQCPIHGNRIGYQQLWIINLFLNYNINIYILMGLFYNIELV
jgi:hypothetical protein